VKFALDVVVRLYTQNDELNFIIAREAAAQEEI